MQSEFEVNTDVTSDLSDEIADNSLCHQQNFIQRFVISSAQTSECFRRTADLFAFQHNLRDQNV